MSWLEERKKTFYEMGLVQNDLFVYGTGKRTWYDIHHSLPVGFTFVDGELIITPIEKNTILTDKAVRINKTNVKELRFKKDIFGDLYLVVRYNSGKKSEYFVMKPIEVMKKIVDMYNSQSV